MLTQKDSLVAYWSQENAVLKDRGHFHYASCRMFEYYLPGFSGGKILDVGCGHGMMMEHFRRSGNQVYGIDITSQSIQHNLLQGLTALEADARRIPFKDGTFDLVYSLGVIEHFDDTQTALHEQVRVCKPGGCVVAVVPILVTPLCPAAIGFELVARPEHSLQVTYGKAYTKSKLAGMLAAAGCREIRVEPYYGSAFLRALPMRLNVKLTDIIENSFFSRQAGLVLWGQGIKGGP